MISITETANRCHSYSRHRTIWFVREFGLLFVLFKSAGLCIDQTEARQSGWGAYALWRAQYTAWTIFISMSSYRSYKISLRILELYVCARSSFIHENALCIRVIYIFVVVFSLVALITLCLHNNISCKGLRYFHVEALVFVLFLFQIQIQRDSNSWRKSVNCK